MAKKASNPKKFQQKKKGAIHYCALREAPERTFTTDVTPGRVRLIRQNESKWMNETVIHYYFFNQPASWRGKPAELEIVRKAFKKWKGLGIGLEFKEVDSPDEAEVRIGFLRGDGAWSYLGRDVLNYGASERTMNFGWNISDDIDTAIHEIGHTLGFPHEHQNPFAGIEWDEEAVYAALAQPPNNWSRGTTWWNIIRKINPDEVQGSRWDPNSIMHYPFEPGLILKPEQYTDTGLWPAPGLSKADKEWALTLYPSVEPKIPKLSPFKFVRLKLNAGEQANFEVDVPATRTYNFQTFGNSDTVMVLFEEIDGEPRYVTGDDDSGFDYNAKFKVKLFSGKKYILRLRLYWAHRTGDFGVLMW
jgi:hypothetical protein